jgi:hypothetical protein
MKPNVKPRPWQEIAVEITKEKNLDKAIKLAGELLHSLEASENLANVNDSSAQGTSA